MQEVTITKVYRTTKAKDGTPLKTKDGKPYERIAIKMSEYGDRWASGFGSSQTDAWNVGDKIQIEIEDTGQYLNFRVPSKIDLLESRIEKLEQAVFSDDKKPDAPSDEINIEDIPF